MKKTVVAAAMAAVFAATSQAAMIIGWGITNGTSQTDIVSANTDLQNVGATLGSGYAAPNAGANGYYAGTANPAGKNPLFYAADNNNLAASAIAAGELGGDVLRLNVANGQTGQALWFWGKNMVYNSATPGTPSGYTDAQDYGFQNGLNAVGNVTITSLVMAGEIIGAQAGTSRSARFVINQGGTYYISANAGNVQAGGNMFAYTGLALDALTWAAFDPNSSIVLTGSETFATLENYENIEGAGVWMQFTSNNNSKSLALSGFQVEAIPEPATLGLIAAFGGAIMMIRRHFQI